MGTVGVGDAARYMWEQKRRTMAPSNWGSDQGDSPAGDSISDRY